jgi:mannose-6-phosphate isomerase class I
VCLASEAGGNGRPYGELWMGTHMTPPSSQTSDLSLVVWVAQILTLIHVTAAERWDYYSLRATSSSSLQC